MKTQDTTPAIKVIVHVARKYAEITEQYLEHREKDVRQMLAALEQGNYDRIWALGHNMKGTGAAFGLDYITEMGRSIEKAAKDEEPKEVPRLTAKLRNYLGRVEVVADQASPWLTT